MGKSPYQRSLISLWKLARFAYTNYLFITYGHLLLSIPVLIFYPQHAKDIMVLCDIPIYIAALHAIRNKDNKRYIWGCRLAQNIPGNWLHPGAHLHHNLTKGRAREQSFSQLEETVGSLYLMCHNYAKLIALLHSNSLNHCNKFMYTRRVLGQLII